MAAHFSRMTVAAVIIGCNAIGFPAEAAHLVQNSSSVTNGTVPPAAVGTADIGTQSNHIVQASRRTTAGDRALVPGLVLALSDPDDTVSLHAASMLAVIGPHSADVAIPILISRIAARQEQTDLPYRRSMASALTAIAGGPDKAAGVLMKILKHSRSAVARANAAAAIGLWDSFEPADGDIGKNDPLHMAFAGALPSLASAVARDDDPTMRVASLSAIRQMAAFLPEALWKKAIPHLGSAVADTRLPSTERIAVLRFLRTIPVVAASAAPGVRRAVNDPNTEVAVNASATLMYLATPSLAQDGTEFAKWRDRLDSPISSERDQAAMGLSSSLNVSLFGHGDFAPLPEPAWLPALIPELIEEMHSQKYWIPYDAAGMLALIGPEALQAAPDLMAIAAHKTKPFNESGQIEMARYLMYVLGSPAAAGRYLENSLSDPDIAVRCNAATCLGLRILFIDHATDSKTNYFHEVGRRGHRSQPSFTHAIPALARAAVEDVSSVRLASLISLDAYSQEAPTDLLKIASRAVAPRMVDRSLSVEERQAAAAFMGHVIVSVPDTLPYVREAILSDDHVVHGYAILSLNRFLELDPQRTINAFTGDLSSCDAADRLSAARQITASAKCIWGNGTEDMAIGVAHEPDWQMPGFKTISGMGMGLSGPRDYDDTYRESLVIALATALSDRDPAVRIACAKALVALSIQPGASIGQSADMKKRHRLYDPAYVYRSIKPRITEEIDRGGMYSMKPILQRAQKSIEAVDPALATSINDMITAVPHLEY